MVVNSKSGQKYVVQKSTKDACVEGRQSHGPLITDTVRGEILCASCGAVLVDKVEDTTPEQKSFSLEDYNNNTRTGMASTLSIHDKGLSTIIGNANRDAAGNSISGYMKYTFNRLRTWDSRSKQTSSERNLRTAFAVMSSIQSKLEISDAVVERAAYLYRKALAKNIIRGRTIKGMILSALCIACRESNVPRTLSDIAREGNVTVKELSRNYRIFVKSLDLQVDAFDPSEFISKIGTAVGSSEKAKRDALDILYRAKEKGITDGKSPISLAATAIFMSGILNEEEYTQNNIAKASGVSSVTIRNVARILRKSLGIEN